MIRKAFFYDIGSIEATYNEHFRNELAHGAFTVFKQDIYPTKEDAKKAIEAGNLYVYEENGRIAGSVIADSSQPPEYAEIVWGQLFTDAEVMVIHLLLVRPSMAGKGIASALVEYIAELARNRSCKAVRLDTGKQNIPAVSLYQKAGFQIAATASMKVGGAIEHSDHLFLEKLL